MRGRSADVHAVASTARRTTRSTARRPTSTSTCRRHGRRRVPRALADRARTADPRARPDLVVFLAGADPWEGDALGRLALTKAGLRARDELVLGRADALGVPCCVTLAGGYAPDVEDTVEIAFATAELIAHRARGSVTKVQQTPT